MSFRVKGVKPVIEKSIPCYYFTDRISPCARRHKCPFRASRAQPALLFWSIVSPLSRKSHGFARMLRSTLFSHGLVEMTATFRCTMLRNLALTLPDLTANIFFSLSFQPSEQRERVEKSRSNAADKIAPRGLKKRAAPFYKDL